MRSLRLLFLAFALCAASACSGSDSTPKPDAAAGAVDAPPGGPDAAPGTVDAAPMGGTKNFMDPCPSGMDSECMTGLVCFNFQMKGPHCTHACTTAADCPAPSPGCSGMGVCKAP